MTVTSGFYVRSFCHDLGEKLGCGGMMAELNRTRQGQFVLGGDNCMEYDDLLKGEDVWGPKVRRMLELWNDPNAKAERAKSGEASSASTKADEDKEAQAGKHADESKVVQEGETEESPEKEDRQARDSKPAGDGSAPEPGQASTEEGDGDKERAAAAAA
ncbi:hypothetical protein VTH06DRAFT_6463 [Thermothelomyces fergusii]